MKMSSENIYLDQSIWGNIKTLNESHDAQTALAEEHYKQDQEFLNPDEIYDYDLSDEEIHENDYEEELGDENEALFQSTEKEIIDMQAYNFHGKDDHYERNKGRRKRGRQSYKETKYNKSNNRGQTLRTFAKHEDKYTNEDDISDYAQKKSASEYRYRNYHPNNAVSAVEILEAIAENSDFDEGVHLNSIDQKIKHRDKLVAPVATRKPRIYPTAGYHASAQTIKGKRIFDPEEVHSKYNNGERSYASTRIQESRALREKRERIDRILGRETILASSLISSREP